MQLLTIVFTDVVESSATKRDTAFGRDSRERDRAYLEKVQTRHFQLIRECCRARGGQEVSTIGDAFYLTFDDPAEAVRCAVDIQQRLAAAPIETPRGPLGIRVGVHSGYPEHFEGSWHGTDVDAAARVEGAASQRQILLSSRTYELVRHMSDVKFHACGEFALKGMERMALWEADWDGKGPRPTALAPLGRQRRKRRAQIAAAAGFVLVTALAGYRIHFARKARPVKPPGSVEARPSVAVIGFRNLSGRQDEAWLSTALSETMNSELATGGQLRVISGENVSRLKGDLSLPDTDSYAPDTLHRIRGNLGTDYVIEGSYVVYGSSPDRRIRVDARLQNAESGETVAAVVENGNESQLNELFAKAGADLRARLGAGPPTALEQAAARAVLPANPQAARYYAEGLAKLRVFDALAARDLLQKAVAADPDSATAHSALASAWSALGYRTRAAQEAKMAVDLSTDLSREDRLSIEGQYCSITNDWSRAIDLTRQLFQAYPDNVVYGLRLADAQTSAGKAPDAFLTLAALRTLSHPLGDDARIDVAESFASDSIGDYKRELEAATRAAQKGSASGARLVVARARRLQGAAYRGLGENNQAMAMLQEASQLYAQAGDQGGRPLVNMGAILAEQGDFEGARRKFEEVLSSARQTGDKSTEAIALSDIAHVSADQGDLARAKSLYVQTISIQREIEDIKNAGSTLSNLGHLLCSLGEYAEAGKTLEESLAIARQVGNKRSQAYVLGFLAELLYYEGDLKGSQAHYQESLTVALGIGHKRVVVTSLSGIGGIFFAQDDLAAAEKQQNQALATARDIGEKGSAAKARLELARISLEKGLPTEAEAFARDAAEEFHGEQAHGGEASAQATLARAFLAQGKADDARKAVALAAGAAQQTQDRAVSQEVALSEAQSLLASGQPAAAINTLRLTQAQALKIGCIPCDFRARFELGHAEMKSGKSASGQARLAVLEKDAAAKGFLQIAHHAAAALK